MTYQDFKNSHLGNGYDVDGAFGDQCWDGYAEYCNYLGVPYANCTNTGYARDLWEQRHSNGILNYFDEVELMQAGDIAIFQVDGSTPYSHVAIFDSDVNGVYGNFLGQNQGGAQTNPNGGGVFNIVQLPYSATYPTAFRLKGNYTNQPVEATTEQNRGVSGGLAKGDYFLDVSAYQPADLTDICNQAGTKNTIIKVTEGDTWLSPVATQQTNTSNCIGYYHFARFGGDVNEAIKEANYFISNLPSRPRYLVCDYEDSASGNQQANTNAVLAFMDKCKEAGFEPIYYSYKPYTLANIYVDQITSKYPNSLWIAGYPDYEVRPDPYWGVYPDMEHIRWWQFTSTAIAGGLDKNVVIIPSEGNSVVKEQEEDELMNFVVRSVSGTQGYIVIVNGHFFGASDMGTIDQMMASGAKHLTLPDEDFHKFIDAHVSNDNGAVAKAIEQANANVVKEVEDAHKDVILPQLGEFKVEGTIKVSQEGQE